MTEEETKPAVTRKRRFRGIVQIDREQCKGCGFCVEFCPNSVLAMSSEFNLRGYHNPIIVNEDACTGGGLCSAICPDFAIFAQCVKDGGNQEQSR